MQLFSQGSAIVIETSRENLSYLRLNTLGLHYVTIIKKAIGIKRGLLSFTGQVVSAGVDENANDCMEMDTLDKMCGDLKIAPTLLKMNMEDYEGHALKGLDTVNFRLMESDGIIRTFSATLPLS
jgi:hypothetical protein